MFRKDLALADCEIKFAGDSVGSFEGYASVFGGVDSYGDTIVRGAYADTLKDRRTPVLMLYGHNPGRVIGKWTALAEDSRGLHVRGELTPGHTDAENTRASLKHGAISGMSIGYYVPEGGASISEDGKSRTLSKISLVEISVVSMPADDAARIDLSSVKSMLDQCTTFAELEDVLRDAAMFSRSSAKAFLARVKDVALREAEAADGLKGIDLSILNAIPKSLICKE